MNIALIVTDAGPLITTLLHGLQRRRLIPDAELILDRATAIRGATARVSNALACRGAEDALDAWLD